MSILGSIDAPEAVETLVKVSIDAENPPIRYAAVAQLKAKPLADYVPALLSEMAMPVETSLNIQAVGNRMVSKYSYAQEQAGGQELTRNRVSYQYVRGPRYLAVPLHRYKLESPARTITGRTARVPKIRGHGKVAVPVPTSPCSSGGQTYRWVYQESAMRTISLPDLKVPDRYSARYAGMAYLEDPNYAARQGVARQKLVRQARNEEAYVNEQNRLAQLRNERIAEVLAKVTGERIEAFPKSWWNWWANYLEHHPDVATEGTRQQLNTALLNEQKSGLARGTWVWTRTGKKAIESVRIGDYVLSQDPSSGELSYKVVLAISTAQRMPVSKVESGESTLHCAPGHVVWATGLGWKRLSHLVQGQSLHGVETETAIDHVGQTFEIECYDLIVDDFHTLFVGEQGHLVHDGTPIHPSYVALPGFSPAEVAEAAKLAAR